MYKHIVSAFCFFSPFFRLRRHSGRLLTFLALGLGQLQLPLHLVYGKVLQSFALQNFNLAAMSLIESGHCAVAAQVGIEYPVGGALNLAHRPYRHGVLVKHAVLGPHRHSQPHVPCLMAVVAEHVK